MSEKIFQTKSIESLAIATLCSPFIFWMLIVGIFAIKRQFVPNISEKSALRVDTWLVGQRYNDAGVSEVLSKTGDKQWVGIKSSVELNPSNRTFVFKASNFDAPTTLTYDGYRWSGFTTKPGRGMPVAVEMWPD